MEDRGDTVVVGVDGTLGALIAGRLGACGVKLRCPDMTKDEPMKLDHARTVIHAAGPRARPGLGWSDYFREHFGTSRSIVKAMASGSHLILLSSTAVYGARAGHLDADSPEAPLRFPMAAYASAKYAAELAIRAWCQEKGLGLTVLRLSMVYGPGVDSALESLRKIAARGMRLVLKPPSLRQHLLSLDLLVHGLTQACRLGPLGPRPLILADPFTATNEEINDAIARKYPAAYSVSVPLNFIGTLSRQWQRCPEFGLTMPIASLAVLAIDNEFDWHPAFQALGIDSLEFDRNRTFDRYLS